MSRSYRKAAGEEETAICKAVIVTVVPKTAVIAA
jgi:hypothetical protein